MTRFFLCLVLVLSAAFGALAAPEAGAGAKDKITVDEKTEAVIKGALKWLASKQLPNGWFRDCCLIDASRPLLHTIAYTMQGLIGIGVTANRPARTLYRNAKRRS